MKTALEYSNNTLSEVEQSQGKYLVYMEEYSTKCPRNNCQLMYVNLGSILGLFPRLDKALS